ncbi:hypothetical protein K474DRAFT_211639 [Panus rudis PR-1116 ss-1]|nr:hypothetical protein K474DRAFT_211639 [Panus rudis PR-1116 ss-1]
MPSSSSRLVSSVSSFDYLSSNPHSRAGSDSSDSYVSDISLSDTGSSSEEDEIVLSFSDVSSVAVSQRAQSPNVYSDDDFIVLSRARSPERFQSLAAGGSVAVSLTGDVDSLAQTLAQLEVHNAKPKRTGRKPKAAIDATSSNSPPPSLKKRNRKKKSAASLSDNAQPSLSTHSASSESGSPKKVKKNKKKKLAAAAAAAKKTETPKSAKVAELESSVADNVDPAGLGERPIVDDVSEAGDHRAVAVGYEEAVEYITSSVFGSIVL